MTAANDEKKPVSMDQEYIQKLAQLPEYGYEQVRGSFASGLGVRKSYLDAEVKKYKDSIEKESKLPYQIVEPWHESINPEILLNEIAHTISRFIVCQKEIVTAATLWIAMTWFLDAIHVAPLAIILELRRKRPQEEVDRIRHAQPGLFENITAKLARFSQDYDGEIRASKPALPDTLHDRAQDNWEPLIAIASLAGEEWLKRTYDAANHISGNNEQSISLGVELLTDVYNIIETVTADRISSAELIEKLCQDPEKPWSTYNKGNPISPRQIASRLKSFGITSSTIRIGTATAKGYQFVDFADAISRYIAPDR